MTILVYGQFGPDALEHSYVRAFRVLGHRAVAFDVATEGRTLLRNRLIHRLIRNHFGARRWLSRGFNARLLAIVDREKPHLLVAFRGDFLMPETVRHVKTLGCKVVIFNPDNPFPPNPSARPEHLRTALQADVYLIWSAKLAEQLRAMGVNNAQFFPFGWDPDFHSYHLPNGPKTHDVVFIGNWDQKREIFLQGIARHFPLKIWGNRAWKTRTRRGSRLKTCWQGGPVVGAAFSDVVAQTAIVLNVFRDQHAPGGVIMRTFEVPGAGGFLLSEGNDDVRALFPEGETGAYFTDVRDCVEKIRYWLAHPAEREALARRARERVAGEFTYGRLAAALLDSAVTD